MPDGMLVLIVFVMGMIGAVAVLPYGFAMGRNQLAQVKLPRWKLVLVTLVNNAVLFAAASSF